MIYVVENICKCRSLVYLRVWFFTNIKEGPDIVDVLCKIDCNFYYTFFCDDISWYMANISIEGKESDYS